MQPKKTAHSTAHTQHMAVRAGLTTSHNLKSSVLPTPPHSTRYTSSRAEENSETKPIQRHPVCKGRTYRDAVAQTDLRGGRQVALCAQQQRGGLTGRHRSPGFEQDLGHLGGVKEAGCVQTVVPRRLR
jgi:hypothetical protein